MIFSGVITPIEVLTPMRLLHSTIRMAALASDAEKYATKDASAGAMKRQAQKFRGTIEAGGAHPPEAGRYRLYAAAACPWAHRCMVTRALKGADSGAAATPSHRARAQASRTSSP